MYFITELTIIGKLMNSYILQNIKLRIMSVVELYLLYAFFWVIPRRLNFICRHFQTLCLFHLHRQVGAYEDGTDRVF